MIRRIFRLVAMAGAVAGAVAVVRALTRQNDSLPSPAASSGEPWPPPTRTSAAPTAGAPAADRGHATPAPAATETVAPEPAGVPVASDATGSSEPTHDGECPAGFPIKANLKSGIFHAPGQLNYDRTTPDRCYADAASAEADGLRAAKR